MCLFFSLSRSSAHVHTSVVVKFLGRQISRERDWDSLSSLSAKRRPPSEMSFLWFLEMDGKEEEEEEEEEEEDEESDTISTAPPTSAAP